MTPPHESIVHAILALEHSSGSFGYATRDETTRISHRQWASDVTHCAGNFAEFGLFPGDNALVASDDPATFMLGFAACLLAGVKPAAVDIPVMAKDNGVSRLAPLLNANVVLGRPRNISMPAGVRFLDIAEIATASSSGTPLVEPSHDAHAFTQFSSGSTREPQAFHVPHRHLAANVDAIAGALTADTGDDHLVSWLPFHHDMGLVGMFLGTVWSGISATYLAPHVFLRRPTRWLDVISETGATISSAPNFAYQMIVDADPTKDSAWDLSKWRIAGCGGERVRATTLDRVASRLAPHGFEANAMCPAYGMAEVVVAVSFNTGPVRRIERDGQAVFSCGAPVAGMTVTVVGSDGAELADGEVGELVVRGDSVLSEDGYHTGDVGFLDAGEIFVCGRAANLAIVDGHVIHLEDVEAVASNSSGVDALRVAAFPVPVESGDRIVVAVEAGNKLSREAVIADITGAVSAAMNTSVEVHFLARGAFLRTTSGKPRRQQMRASYMEQSTSSATSAT